MYTGVSNLASSMRMARANTETKLALNTAGQEVASGRMADLMEATGGDLAPLFVIERNMAQLDLRAAAIRDASAKAAASQLNMANIQDTLADYGTELLTATDINSQPQAFSIATRHATRLTLWSRRSIANMLGNHFLPGLAWMARRRLMPKPCIMILSRSQRQRQIR